MHISIVGCGWLGQPLANQLQLGGHSIVATCRSEEKRQALTLQGYSSHIFQLGDDLSSQALKVVFQSSLLILNLPPGGRHIQPEFYTEQMCQLISEAHKQGMQNIIFISTTAVYAEKQDKVVEHSPLAPATASGKAHQRIEQHVIDVFAEQGCVIRLAGLVGKGRHPATYLAGRKALENGSNLVNLVHQHDVVKAIKAIIEQKRYGDIFHLCSHEHPSRRDYYLWSCAQLQLELPEFCDELQEQKSKFIDAHWTCKRLGLTLTYPSPYNMLD
jgi:nucleoside-diphosphate-sugar epimerase